MNSHKIEKLPKNTVKIILSIPWKNISSEYDKAFETLAKDVTVEGFRKGKAPKAVAQKALPKDKVFDRMLRDYLPAQYEVIVKKEELKPIYSPKIELIKAKENEDWEVHFSVAQKPEVDIKKYKEIVKKAMEEASKPEIWTPGKDKDQKEPDERMKKEMAIQAALNALVDKTKIEISDVVLEEEIQNRLSRLVDDLQRLGITVENYVKSKNITEDQLKEQFSKEIEETYKLEFILQEIGDAEKIQVEKEDIEKMMGNLKDDKERQAFMQNIYYYASVLRKQKIIDHIATL